MSRLQPRLPKRRRPIPTPRLLTLPPCPKSDRVLAAGFFMADLIEEPRPEEVEEIEEDGGGPVKTFLEHLEDLRWMLIKSGTALLIGMIVCLYATDKVVSILKWPLERAALIQVGHKQKVLVKLGEEDVISFQPATNRIGPLDLGTNPFIILQIEPVEEGTNIHFVARLEKNPPTGERASS